MNTQEIKTIEDARTTTSSLKEAFDFFVKLKTGIEIESKIWARGIDLQIKGMHASCSVEIRYEQEFGEPEYIYKVSTSLYGSLQPDSKRVNAVILQAQFLTNEELIKAAIEAINDMRELSEYVRENLNN